VRFGCGIGLLQRWSNSAVTSAMRHSERRKGYGNKALAMVLEAAMAMGLRRFLLTRDPANTASSRIMEKNGGLEDTDSVAPNSGRPHLSLLDTTMRMNTRTIALLSVVLTIAALAMVLLTGCSTQKPGVTTIRFTSWGNDVEEVNLRALIAQLEKDHPKIHVEIEITPWARMLDKLMISSAGGRPPDVTRISSEWFPPIAAKGLLEPLDKYVARDKYDLNDFYPESINGWGKWKGQLLEIPTDIDIYAMYYNKAIFDKNHIPYPDETWDWDKYLEVAKKLTQDTDGDGKVDQWGTTLDMW
jgi:hypothetical protein